MGNKYFPCIKAADAESAAFCQMKLKKQDKYAIIEANIEEVSL